MMHHQIHSFGFVGFTVLSYVMLKDIRKRKVIQLVLRLVKIHDIMLWIVRATQTL